MEKLARSSLLGLMMVSTLVGCGAEVAVIAPAMTEAAAAAGAFGGLIWLGKSIENVSLDTQKKVLEIRAIQDGVQRR